MNQYLWQREGGDQLDGGSGNDELCLGYGAGQDSVVIRNGLLGRLERIEFADNHNSWALVA